MFFMAVSPIIFEEIKEFSKLNNKVEIERNTLNNKNSSLFNNRFSHIYVEKKILNNKERERASRSKK